MTFIVTARKWRPQLFDDVVGQQHISTTLKNAIENNRIGHAYIFAGPRGVGKTTTARILAKRLNCEKPNGGEPCNNCQSCNNFLKTQSLDIIEIDGASNRRIDEIRTLRESVKYAPTSGNYKVYIIDEVHMLTTESFNALLKTLEEPPEHTIFIFATTDIHKVPLTIISRCQRFDFKRIEMNAIVDLLAKIAESENISIDVESLTLIAKKADGALRDAQSIFDQVVSFCGENVDVSILKQMLNLIDEEIYFQISDSILNKDFKIAFEVSTKIYSNGWNFIDFINGLIEHFRNISSVIIAKTTDFIESSDSLKAKYTTYKDKFSEGDLLRILSYLSKVQNEIRSSQNQKLKIEICLTHLIGFEKSSTISELIEKSNSFVEEPLKKKTNLIPQNESTSKESPSLKINIPNNLPKVSSPKRKSQVAEKIVKLKPEEKPLSDKVKNSSEDFTLIQNNWADYKSIMTKERFTLGPLLEHTILSSFENNTINVDVSRKEDVAILNSSIDFLSKRFNELYKTKIIFAFRFNKNLSLQDKSSEETTFVDSDDTYKDHPLVKSIITQLGGKEI